MNTMYVISSSTDCVYKRRKCMKITCEDSEWSPDDNPPDLHIFEEQCGVIVALDHTSSAFDCFSIFMPLEIIKSKTNRYSYTIINKLRRQNGLKPNSFWSKWERVKLHEMYHFLQ